MSLTQTEILSQYQALEQSRQEINEKKEELLSLFHREQIKKIAFIGCGSSYCLAKSAAAAANVYLDVPAFAFAAGDLLFNGNRYGHMLDDALVISLSRSGDTSEVLLAVRAMRTLHRFLFLSVSERVQSGTSALADFNIELPWAFDNSVCQTRSVTNLYFAGMMLIGIFAQNNNLLQSLTQMVTLGEQYMQQCKPICEEIAKKDWRSVVVLADGELNGIAEEGALAFKEISAIPSGCHCVMDVRHGPIVLIDESTLVIVMLSPGASEQQQRLVADLKKKGALVVVIHSGEQDNFAADHFIELPAQGEFAAYGVPFIFVPQMIACAKAEQRGINPDLPNGLEPCIKL